VPAINANAAQPERNRVFIRNSPVVAAPLWHLLFFAA